MGRRSKLTNEMIDAVMGELPVACKVHTYRSGDIEVEPVDLKVIRDAIARGLAKALELGGGMYADYDRGGE